MIIEVLLFLILLALIVAAFTISRQLEQQHLEMIRQIDDLATMLGEIIETEEV